MTKYPVKSNIYKVQISTLPQSYKKPALTNMSTLGKEYL